MVYPSWADNELVMMQIKSEDKIMNFFNLVNYLNKMITSITISRFQLKNKIINT